MLFQNCEIPSGFIENMNIDEWESKLSYLFEVLTPLRETFFTI